MRLDHFVQLPTPHNNKGDIMSKLETPSVTSSRGYASSHLTWVQTMQKDMEIQVWGRIKDTGANFIVEGWTYPQGAESRTEWVRIPCQNLATTQMHLGSVMDKLSFDMEQIRQRLDRAENDKLAQEILATI